MAGVRPSPTDVRQTVAVCGPRDGSGPGASIRIWGFGQNFAYLGADVYAKC